MNNDFIMTTAPQEKGEGEEWKERRRKGCKGCGFDSYEHYIKNGDTAILIKITCKNCGILHERLRILF